MKLAWFAPVAALLLVAAQDCPDGKCPASCDGKQDCCGAVGILCPKDGKCEGKCREICDNVGATLKSVRARVGEIMKKEVGEACPCASGSCKEAKCGTCTDVVAKIYAPLLKDKVGAWMKSKVKDPKHTVKTDDGKTQEVACTFLSKKPCDVCVNDLANASWTKLKECMKDCDKSKNP